MLSGREAGRDGWRWAIHPTANEAGERKALFLRDQDLDELRRCHAGRRLKNLRDDPASEFFSVLTTWPGAIPTARAMRAINGSIIAATL